MPTAPALVCVQDLAIPHDRHSLPAKDLSRLPNSVLNLLFNRKLASCLFYLGPPLTSLSPTPPPGLQAHGFVVHNPRSGSPNGGDNGTNTGTGKGKAPSRRSERRHDPLRRAQSTKNGGANREAGSVVTSKSRRHSVPAGDERVFACPCWKRNPLKFRDCLMRNRLTATSFVKQHLLDRHEQQPIHCPRCGQKFGSRDDCNNHITQEPRCPRRNFGRYEGLDDDQIQRLRQLRGHLNEAERWYAIWDAMYQDGPRPASPFVDSDPMVELVGVLRRALQHYVRNFTSRPLQETLNWQYVRGLIPDQENLLHLTSDGINPPGGVFNESRPLDGDNGASQQPLPPEPPYDSSLEIVSVGPSATPLSGAAGWMPIETLNDLSPSSHAPSGPLIFEEVQLPGANSRVPNGDQPDECWGIPGFPLPHASTSFSMDLGNISGNSDSLGSWLEFFNDGTGDGHPPLA